MARLRFAKYQGLGNDFLVVEAGLGARWPTPQAARRLCDRRRGVGADGILTILPPRSPDASVRMHVLNQDGSVAEMCGNGLRCVVRHLVSRASSDAIAIDTDAGLREGWVLDDATVRVTLGDARLLEPSVEVLAKGSIYRGVGISMGNPHLVLEPFPDPSKLEHLARNLGPDAEHHPAFPHGVNVGFMSLADDGVLQLVVHERGVGVTQACGTGAAAAAVAMWRGAGAGGSASWAVRLPGGLLGVEIDAEVEGALARVAIVGEARHVFDGEVEVFDDELRPVDDANVNA